MREDRFLRTPVRGDHQRGLLDLQIGEAPLVGDPQLDQTYPQTLEISFEVAATTPEVQIAPLWEGSLIFLPDSTAGNPLDPVEVTPANYPNWSVTGDLVLVTIAGTHGFDSAFAAHIPLIGRVPAAARYSKIRLTRDFLFTTLKNAPPFSIVFDGQIVFAGDPQFHEKLVINVLRGTSAVPCLQPMDDPGQDTAHKPMPAVVLEPPGTRSVLRVTVSSVSEKVSDLAWFERQSDYDDLSGEPLVDPALQTDQDIRYNPAHPCHSVIPAWALFQAAAPAAYAPDHDSGAPVRMALTAARSDGLVYRRVDLLRPPIPGAPVSAAPQRPYPQYQLCWRLTDEQRTRSLRIPLSGQIYLPLADRLYAVSAIPRSADPELVFPGQQLRLSVARVSEKVIGLPQATVGVDFAAADTRTLYAHLQPYDALYVWDGYAGVSSRRGSLQAEAEADWNATIFDWYVVPTTAPESPSYAPVYGFLRESAGRHGLAPEFLQTVLFGEGTSVTFRDAINRHETFDPLQTVDAFFSIGLDLILYRTGGLMPDGSPPAIPEIPESEVDELAEYHYNLVAEGYVDPATAAAVTWSRQERNEKGRLIQVASIAGWAAAIELVAAELHARLDEMRTYLAGKVPAVEVEVENQRRYLAYVRFNSTLATAKTHADSLPSQPKKWAGSRPTTRRNALYNTIQRIAVTQWHERAGIYR
jgi:hypothetical protein